MLADYSDIIMSVMASQITVSMVYSTVYSGADKKNTKAPVTGGFPSQSDSNA